MYLDWRDRVLIIKAQAYRNQKIKISVKAGQLIALKKLRDRNSYDLECSGEQNLVYERVHGKS